jgi:H/ACA ribonucleoprotein complex subunit 3
VGGRGDLYALLEEVRWMVKWLLRRCGDCGRYTLHTDSCPYCGGEVRIPHPAKFSIDDRYVKYRIVMKAKMRGRSKSSSKSEKA